ncbi:lipoprotein [Streptomyces ruber]|uniref:Lipoprotein n=2 Tax=Streptomyces TaxID=1883 RepID=A0A918BI93_9ACTN|nr:DUF4097 family beta strand repeat-containing protein [Streptomyces ruber]GGQ65369.1 lipoprotein [Streptomyces ruber]
MGRSVRGRAMAVGGVVALLVAGVAACGADAGDDGDPEQRSFPLRGRVLTVDSDDYALELVPADVDEVRVTRWFQDSVVVGKDPRLSWEMKDDRLRLRVRCSGFIADCSARHRVEVPRDVAVTVKGDDGSVTAKGFTEALSIGTDDADVRVSGSGGPLTVRTKDGSVRVSDVRGALEVYSEDGSVRAERVGSRSVKAGTEDGAVRLSLAAVPDRVEARSVDGSVDVSLPRGTYRVTAESSDGSVDVSVPRDETSEHVIGVRTEDGSIKVRTAN